MAFDWTTGGIVGVKNCHGRYLSWAPGGDCRANEDQLRNEEKWLIKLRSDGANVFCKVCLHLLFHLLLHFPSSQTHIDHSYSLENQLGMVCTSGCPLEEEEVVRSYYLLSFLLISHFLF